MVRFLWKPWLFQLLPHKLFTLASSHLGKIPNHSAMILQAGLLARFCVLSTYVYRQRVYIPWAGVCSLSGFRCGRLTWFFVFVAEVSWIRCGCFGYFCAVVVLTFWAGRFEWGGLGVVLGLVRSLLHGYYAKCLIIWMVRLVISVIFSCLWKNSKIHYYLRSWFSNRNLQQSLDEIFHF